MNRRSKLVALSIAGIVAIAVAVALAPVALVAKGGVSDSAVRAGSWERHALPVSSKLQITQSDPGTALIVLPELSSPEVFPASEAKLSGTFTYDRKTRIFTSQGPGRISYEGFFGDVVVVLAATSTAPVTVTRSSSDGTEGAVLRPADAGPNGATIRTFVSPKSEFVQSNSYLFRTFSPPLEDPAKSSLTAIVGTETVLSDNGESVGSAQILFPALYVVLRGILVFLAALGIVWGAWLLGRSLDPQESRSLSREVVRLLLGAGVLLCVVNTLAYLVPASWAAVVGLGASGAVVVARFAKSRPRGLAISAKYLGDLSLTALIPTAIAFFPVFYFGLDFAGTYKTDLSQYASLASMVRDHSLLAMQNLANAQNAGVLTSGAGIVWRTIDTVGATALGFLAGLGSFQALALMGIVVFLVLSFGLFALCRQFNSKRWWAVVVLALLSPLLSGLFIENYNSHFFFLCFIPGFMLLIGQFLAASEVGFAPRERAFLTWAIAATAGVLVSVYPYFFVVAAVGLGLAVLSRKKWLWAMLRATPTIIVKTLLFCNLALLTVLNYGETERYQAALDGIAESVILNPYSQVQRVALFFGYVPFQWRIGDQAPLTGLGRVVDWLCAIANDLWVVGPLDIVAVTLACGAVAAGIRWRKSFATFEMRAVSGLLFVWLAFTTYLVVSHSEYAAFKAAWTSAVILPIILAVATYRDRRLPVVLIGLALSAGIWVAVGVADRLPWMLSPTSRASLTAHSSIQYDLSQVRQALEGASTLELVAGREPLGGSDRDVVAAMDIAVVANDMGLWFPRESVKREDLSPGEMLFGSGIAPVPVPLSDACKQTASALIVVGRTDRSELCGHKLAYDGAVVQIFR